MFDNLEVLVSFNGISGPGSFAQAATDGSQIFVQASWAAVADALRIRAARDNYFTTHYDYQLAVGVLQILHELAHCFLPAILMLDYRLQIVRNVPEPIKLHAIPVKMGSEFSEETGKTKGGVGFELEVILTGVGRVYPEFSNYWEISGIHTFTEENISTNRTCKVIVSNQRAWAGRIARSSNPMISDFILETVKNTKKRGRNSAEEREEDLSDGSKTNMRVDARGMIYSCDSEDSGGEDCDEAQLWAEQGLIEKVASGFKSRN